MIDSLLLFVPLAVLIAVLIALNPDDDSGAWGILAKAVGSLVVRAY